jgi:hypothetical protein
MWLIVTSVVRFRLGDVFPFGESFAPPFIVFFKWMKQHLDLAEIKTQTARGIWNDLFISLIAYALLEIQRLESFPKLAARELLRTIKLYLFKKWNEMRLEIQRKPMFTTEGRKSNRGHPKPVPEFTEAYVIVRPLSY